MKPELKAALKTVFVLISVFIIMNVIMHTFHFDQKLFNLHGPISSSTDDPINNIPFVLGIISLNCISAFIGYTISKKKNRDAKAWGIACFIASIWGLIYLSFLPSLGRVKEQG